MSFNVRLDREQTEFIDEYFQAIDCNSTKKLVHNNQVKYTEILTSKMTSKEKKTCEIQNKIQTNTPTVVHLNSNALQWTDTKQLVQRKMVG